MAPVRAMEAAPRLDADVAARLAIHDSTAWQMPPDDNTD